MVGHAASTYDIRISGTEVLRLHPDGTVARVRSTGASKLSGKKKFEYIHAFGIQDPSTLPSDNAVRDLGIAMMAEPRAFRAGTIPSGYTYLGQFIFHDITFVSQDRNDLRSPALDLDSVVGSCDHKRRRADCADADAFPIGHTTQGVVFAEDLPRIGPGLPSIADRRNDDFLPLAQCHLSLLKFYNTIARRLGPGSSIEVFPLWLKHFQFVVLHDYLPRIVGREIYDDVVNCGRKIIGRPPIDGVAEWMPIEFALAFGRFGHSMIRDDYQPWNDRLPHTSADVTSFMRFSYRNSHDHLAEIGGALDFRWIPNWFRLFDFTGGRYAGAAPPPVPAGRIDTALSDPLATLPQRIRDAPISGPGTTPLTFNLAVATLVRGLQAQMATAQQAIPMVDALLGVALPRLSSDQLVSGESAAVQKAFEDWPELKERTPLWFYVLKEADMFCDGNTLGPLGSRLVMETVHAAIEASPISISRERDFKPWWPNPDTGGFTMADLITFAGDPNPLAGWKP